MSALTVDVERRLRQERIVWFVSVRPGGSPHVTPVWFVFDDSAWWVATARRNVKVANVEHQEQVSLVLPDAERPVVAQGRARIHRSEFPAAILRAFTAKYDGWDIASDEPDGPRVLIEVETIRWLFAG